MKVFAIHTQEMRLALQQNTKKSAKIFCRLFYKTYKYPVFRPFNGGLHRL